MASPFEAPWLPPTPPAPPGPPPFFNGRGEASKSLLLLLAYCGIGIAGLIICLIIVCFFCTRWLAAAAERDEAIPVGIDASNTDLVAAPPVTIKLKHEMLLVNQPGDGSRVFTHVAIRRLPDDDEDNSDDGAQRASKSSSQRQQGGGGEEASDDPARPSHAVVTPSGNGVILVSAGIAGGADDDMLPASLAAAAAGSTSGSHVVVHMPAAAPQTAHLAGSNVTSCSHAADDDASAGSASRTAHDPLGRTARDVPGRSARDNVAAGSSGVARDVETGACGPGGSSEGGPGRGAHNMQAPPVLSVELSRCVQNSYQEAVQRP